MFWSHERLLVLFQYGRSWLRDFQSSVETYLSNFVRREGIRLETSSKRRVVCVVTSPGPNTRPVAVEPNLILFGVAVTLQLKIALLKTQERLQSSHVQLLLFSFFFFDTAATRLLSSRDQDWSQVEPRPRQNSKTITVDSNSILNWDKEQLMSLVVCRF